MVDNIMQYLSQGMKKDIAGIEVNHRQVTKMISSNKVIESVF